MVSLSVQNAQDVRDASRLLFEHERTIIPTPRISLLVQPMVPKGVEVMVGMSNDPLLGPLLM